MSYISTAYTVLREQFSFIDFLVDRFSEHTIILFKHILASTFRLARMRERLWIPVPSKLIYSKLRNARWKDLLVAGLIDATGYSKESGYCREYAVADWILRDCLEMNTLYSPEEYLKKERVNLFTGKTTKKREKSKLYDSNRNEEPLLIRSAIQAIESHGSLFNMTATQQHLDCLEENVALARARYGVDSKEYQTAQARYFNDYSCFYKGVLDQYPNQQTEHIWSYKPAYSVSSTGRIFQSSGGLQSCSRAMKAAAYSGIEGLRNYDLTASQLHALNSEFQLAGIDNEWLEYYLSSPEVRARCADTVGITVDCWKRCLLALVMGADLPSKIGLLAFKKSDVATYLLEEANSDRERAQLFLDRFHLAIDRFFSRLKEWHSWLLTDFVPKNRKPSGGGHYLRNLAGKALFLDDLPASDSAKARKLAAFLLQGREAAFIHHLTVLGNDYNFRPIANEHDGLVVINEIPEEAVKLAALRSDFQGAELREKHFISQQEHAEYSDEINLLAA